MMSWNVTDVTFNQALGINSSGMIAGYFGSGAAGLPNQGYTVAPPYAQRNFTNENFPGSVQTQVTGINNIGTTVGFWPTWQQQLRVRRHRQYLHERQQSGHWNGSSD